MLVYFTLNGEPCYYVCNEQDGRVEIIDNYGDKVVSYKYDTWGKLLEIGGSLASTVGKKNPYRYRGYRYDDETGLYYLQSRYYNPEIGRFINADGLYDSGGLFGHNMYVYCGNNPVNMLDPSGFCKKAWASGYYGPCPGQGQPGCMDNSLISSESNDFHKPTNVWSINNFKNADGSISLYDNRRHDPDSVFHEQILSAKVTKPSVSLKNGKLTLGSYKATLMTGGWEWKYADLSLMDFGSAKVAAGIHEDKFEATAMASLWDPSITFKAFGVKISFTAHVGSIGYDFNIGKKSFKAAGAFGWGAGLSVDWK